ncbi:MAG: NADH-ubiquinone oxidoreductase [Euryarchaeota archaeon]|nr:NADH-ubiquinone oxidoreductase [Euryarchaeota archaeon]
MIYPTTGSLIYLLLEIISAFIFGGLLLGLHRKIIARIQGRPGPPIIQHLLHTFKFYIKELSIPDTSSLPLYIAIVLSLDGVWILALITVPILLGPFGIVIMCYAIHKVSEHGIGLASGSPYAKTGSSRAVLSATAEMPLIVAPALVFFKTHTLMLDGIITYQLVHGSLFMQLPLCALATFVLVLSKTPYNPFGIVWGKDIVSGHKTEHFGVIRGVLMMGEILGFFVLLWCFLTIFFGGIITTPLAYILAMTGVTVLLAFICALSPMVAPYHSVMIQWMFALLAVLNVIFV